MIHEDGIFWDSPMVQVYRRGNYRVVDYDMWTTGEEISLQATRQLALFVKAYDKANRAKLRRARWWLGAVSGQIETLPGHSQEFAARLLVHISNPRNHDPERHASTRKVYLPGDARRVKRKRQEIEAAYPAFVDDPLSDVPRLPTPPPIPTELRPRRAGEGRRM